MAANTAPALTCGRAAWLSRALVSLADHHDGARGVGCAVLADRAQQHPDERPVASTAQDEQVGTLRNFEKRSCRRAFDNPGLYVVRGAFP